MNELINVTIQNHNGIPVVSSRVIAEQLGKEHSDVMRKCREVLGLGEFSESSYINSQNKEQPELLLTKDGFILLCMNYQGYNDFKRAYINRFNEMEQELKKPMSMLEMIAQMAQEAARLEKGMARVEQKVDGIRDIVALQANGWRNDTTMLINKIAKAVDGSYHDIRSESYKLLEQRMGVDLKSRLLNKQKRMAYEGVSKTAQERVSKLDIIGEDKKLVEGYVSVVKDMAIRYRVNEVAI